MSTTLTAARTMVRNFIDDTDSNPLFTDADIDAALLPAQYEVTQLVVGAGGSNLFNVEATKTATSNGTIDLSAEAPLKVNYVALVVGRSRYQVPPCRNTDWITTVVGPQTIVVGYVARPAFPALAGDPFLWGSTVDAPILTRLMCIIAATELWTKTGDPPLPSLVQREATLREQALASINIPLWTVQPLRQALRYPSGGNAGFQWVMPSRDSMQLVFV